MNGGTIDKIFLTWRSVQFVLVNHNVSIKKTVHVAFLVIASEFMTLQCSYLEKMFYIHYVKCNCTNNLLIRTIIQLNGKHKTRIGWFPWLAELYLLNSLIL